MQITIFESEKYENENLQLQEFMIHGDVIAHDFEVTEFTKTGKLSSKDASYQLIKDAFTTKKFNQALKLITQEVAAIPARKEMAVDQARANKLAEIVNAADFDSELTIAKSKYSHSKWYNSQSGQGNMRSYYEMLVPVSVIKEVRELQAIRRKYQNNADFNFYECNYKTVTNRYADHDNGR